MKTCIRCGRELKDKKSIERKFGPKCYEKYKKELEEIGTPDNQMVIDEVIEGDAV
ncbi:DUF6011 domain-containing protein [Oceanobacillus luteolus]|uniref:DUF6011 domain-containing protein n=1 Tax=Oceanobacillus luteolus TaxID=1274358 RepID=UPI00203C3CEA|nr:DUF6011 domain-containing protein [Oceanobacillus luteolus]MCM3739203.1 DUF6011 domain-containing protein [Oceanobacillus luteolus]